jgi:hypothetical protein
MDIQATLLVSLTFPDLRMNHSWKIWETSADFGDEYNFNASSYSMFVCVGNLEISTGEVRALW